MKTSSRTTKVIAGTALLVAGFGAGAAVMLTGSASAATQAVSGTAHQPDPTRSMRPDEHLLTGTTAAKVRAAALATYPGATVQRVETDSDGVYEAHVVTGGQQVIVQVGKDFTVTGTQTGGGPGGPGGPDGDGGPGSPEGTQAG